MDRLPDFSVERIGRNIDILNIHVETVTPKNKSIAFTIRKKVFVEEQRVPENLEIDKYEDEAIHFLAYVNGEPAGTARLRWLDEHTAKAERVAVIKRFRGNGLGRVLMDALEAAAKQKKAKTVVLHAQTRARPFYERLGYEAYGDLFLDAGIEHIAMKKNI